jgi:Tfp pilus assembly protein PilX
MFEMLGGNKDRVSHVALGEDGIAMFTVLMVLLALIIIGMGVLTMSGLGSRMAGFHRATESAVSAAEGCVTPALHVIQQTIDEGSMPVGLLGNATPPGPVPAGNAAVLDAEIMGQSNNNADGALTAPNTVAVISGFTVRGDIDRLYVMPKSGGAMQAAAGYEGSGLGAATGGIDVLYRIDCTATDPFSGSSARIVVVYACSVTGESCQRKL